jgi:hypothetical protein
MHRAPGCVSLWNTLKLRRFAISWCAVPDHLYSMWSSCQMRWEQRVGSIQKFMCVVSNNRTSRTNHNSSCMVKNAHQIFRILSNPINLLEWGLIQRGKRCLTSSKSVSQNNTIEDNFIQSNHLPFSKYFATHYQIKILCRGHLNCLWFVNHQYAARSGMGKLWIS